MPFFVGKYKLRFNEAGAYSTSHKAGASRIIIEDLKNIPDSEYTLL